MRGPVDRRRRDELGEKLYRMYRNAIEDRRETGILTGPFHIRDWEK